MPYWLAWFVSWAAAFFQFAAFGTLVGWVWLYFGGLSTLWSSVIGVGAGLLYWHLLRFALDKLWEYKEVEFEGDDSWLNEDK